MAGFLKALNKDALTRELAPLLRFEIDPAHIRDYGLPAYKSYQFKKEGELLKRLRKLLAKRKRRQLLQSEPYIRLGCFRDMETWRFLDQLWTAKLDWRATDRFDDFEEQLLSGEKVKLRSKRVLLEDVSELGAYFDEYVKLLESMAERGYIATDAKDRITIMIDRDGSILKETKGRHRLAAAQIVGAPWVPVRVSHIQSAWVDAQAAAHPGASRSELARIAIERTLAGLGAR